MNDKLKSKNIKNKKVLFIFSVAIFAVLISLNAISSNIDFPLIKSNNNADSTSSNHSFNAESTESNDSTNNVSSNNNIINNENNISENNLRTQYRIRIKSDVIINIRDNFSKNGKVVGKANAGDVYDVYESRNSEGYLWQRIGTNMWIADDGTWTETVPNDYAEQRIDFANTNIGSTIYFGKYEQNSDPSDGEEEIEWMVLDNDGSKILLLSKYGLDSRIYNNSFTNWENSSIREWLNNYFYNNAFTDPERCYIEKVTNTTEYNNEAPTNEKVFLLSATEVERYFPNQYDRICYGTKYSFTSGVENFSEKCRWWLRSLNGDEQMALTVRTSEGRINYVTPVDASGYAIRPAIWVKIR